MISRLALEHSTQFQLDRTIIGAFLGAMAASLSSVPDVCLRWLELTAFPEDLRVWLRFADKFGASITSLQLNEAFVLTTDEALAVASVLHAGSPSNDDAHGSLPPFHRGEPICSLFHELRALPMLEILCCFVGHSSALIDQHLQQMFVKRSVEDFIHVASNIVSLWCLHIGYQALAKLWQIHCDAALLHSLLCSETLQELNLADTALLSTLPPGQFSCAIHNHSVKKLSP
jgi:hypothetical protein